MDAHAEVAVEIQRRVDRLINLAEAKFQYIIDIQGNPIRDLGDTKTLAKVVNEHGVVLGELIRTVGALGVVAAQSAKAQGNLLEIVRDLHQMIRELRGDLASTGDFVSKVDSAVDQVASDLVRLVAEVDQRTLVIPESPGDM